MVTLTRVRLPGDTITYTIEITNFADVATDYSINDVLPDGVTYVPDSVTGGALYDEITNAITWSGTVDAPQAPYYDVTDSVSDPLCDTGFGGYVDLAGFGIAANAGITGDTTVWTPYLIIFTASITPRFPSPMTASPYSITPITMVEHPG